MINRLTLTEESRLPEFRDKWLRIGLSCEPLNLTEASIAVKKCYQASGLTVPSFIYSSDSPLSCAIMSFILKNDHQARAQVKAQVWAQARAQVSSQVKAQVWAQVSSQVKAQVWAQARAQVSSQVKAQVKAQVWAQVSSQVKAQVKAQVWAQANDQASSQVWAQVSSQVWAQVKAQVWAQARAQVSSQVKAQVWAQASDQVSSQVWDQVRDQIYGFHETWLSLYDFFLTVCGLKFHKIKPLIALAQHCGWWAPYRGYAILQHRPCELHRNAENRLHNENGMSVKYRDGWGLYALNGVRVPFWLVETRSKDLDPRRLFRINNAQVRTEFVRKIGIDRCFYKLGKVIDKSGNYELGMLELGDGRKRPYLKMLNPSVPDLWHVEGVHPSCDSVASALNWRNGNSEVPIQLT